MGVWPVVIGAPDETSFDQTLIFTLPTQDARGRIVRLGPVLDTILSAHAYPPVVERLLAEALVLTALLGSMLKEPSSQLTLQAQTNNGAITLLVCDYLAGQLRGYVAFDAERLAEAGVDPSLFALFGKGFLGITFDQDDTKQRYQGIVPLEGHCLADAAQTYFRQSEQLPTFARIAVRHSSGTGRIAGGVLVQQLAQPEAEQQRLDVRAEHRDDESRWDHVRALAESLRDEELTSSSLSLETVLWRLFHDEDEVRVARGAPLSRGCRCDPAYLATVIARFPAEERADMAGDDGIIGVDCAFCSRTFAIDPAAHPASH